MCQPVTWFVDQSRADPAFVALCLYVHAVTSLTTGHGLGVLLRTQRVALLTVSSWDLWDTFISSGLYAHRVVRGPLLSVTLQMMRELLLSTTVRSTHPTWRVCWAGPEETNAHRCLDARSLTKLQAATSQVEHFVLNGLVINRKLNFKTINVHPCGTRLYFHFSYSHFRHT